MTHAMALPALEEFGSDGTEDDLRAVDRQMRREAIHVEQGAQRFFKTLDETSFGMTLPGIKLLRGVVADFLPAIILAQEEARKGLAESGPGRQQAWWWLIGWLKPETLAYLVCRTVLDRIMSPQSIQYPLAAPLVSTAIAVSDVVKMEIELELWKQREKKLSKEDPDRTNLYQMMLEYSRVSPKRLALWRRKIETIPKLQWTTNDKVHLGAKLIEILAKNGGGHFGVVNKRENGKNKALVYISQATADSILDIVQTGSLLSPLLMPMVSKPKPWAREEL